MNLNYHSQVSSVILKNTLLVFRQFDCHHVACKKSQKVKINMVFLNLHSQTKNLGKIFDCHHIAWIKKKQGQPSWNALLLLPDWPVHGEQEKNRSDQKKIITIFTIVLKWCFVQRISSQSVFLKKPFRISNYDIFKNWGLAGWSQGSTIKCFITWKASNLNYLTDENFLALFPLYCPQNQNKHKIFIFKTKYWTKIGNYCIYQIIEIEQKLF